MIYGLFAVADATDFALTYTIPQELSSISLGSFCILPVRNRTCVGIYIGECDKPNFICKEILGILPFTKQLPENILKLFYWISEYYLAPIGRCTSVLAPGFIWNSKKLADREKRLSEVFIRNSAGNYAFNSEKIKSLKGEVKFTQSPIVLNSEQQEALNTIFNCEQNTCVLHGVTGSGKTEVYLKASETVLEQGKNVLILVPEIALTPQMLGRFRANFGNLLAVMHSMLTKTEYEREWTKILCGCARIILGVRTAIFAPLTNIGLIIVDEEHDSSYKNEDFPCYHARDVAVKRSMLEQAKCILGSATPSLESLYNVQQNKYSLAPLRQRFSKNLPSIEIIPAKDYLKLNPNMQKYASKEIKSSSICFANSAIASPIIEAIKDQLLCNQQTMVILNRRGYTNYSLCLQCGKPLACPNCSVSTTIHKQNTIERCHYCSFTCEVRKQCPSCGSYELVNMGVGTQNIEQELIEKIPGLKIDRLDRDVLTSNTRLAEILEKFRSGETNCLLGTQILAKGHDFARVTLVVILFIEDGLFLPDFRSAERTFQLLMQSSGRAGRGELKGKVLIQSLFLGNPVIELAINNDFDGFAARELSIRKMGWHPPYVRQILLEIEDSREIECSFIGETLRNNLIEHWKTIKLNKNEIRIAGPYPATLEKLRNNYRYHICISYSKNIHPKNVIPSTLLENPQLRKKVKIDVNPLSFL